MILPAKMSFSGLHYDTGAYRQTIKESVGVGMYSIQTPLPHESGRLGGSHTRVESELFGLGRPLSECPSDNKVPPVKDAPLLPDNINHHRGHLYPEDTRISNAPGNVRGMGVNRFGYPLESPQEHAISPHGIPVNDTLAAKDSHRPCVGNPIDVRDSLPPPTIDNVPMPEYKFVPVPDIPYVQPTQPPREFKYLF